jgi:hypothetical protein
METKDRYITYVVFLTLFMAGHGFTICENWFDCVTLIPAMGVIGAFIGVLLSGLDYLVALLNKLFHPAKR